MASGFDRPRLALPQVLWGMVISENVDFAQLILEDFKFQIKSRKLAKEGVITISQIHKAHHQTIKASKDYLNYLAKSIRAQRVKVKGKGKGLLTKKGVKVVVETVRIPKKRRSKTVIEETGQSKEVVDSVDSKETGDDEEEPQLTRRRQTDVVISRVQGSKASKYDFILKQHPKGPCEGSGLAPKVPDGPRGSSSSSSSDFKDSERFLPTNNEARSYMSNDEKKKANSKKAEEDSNLTLSSAEHGTKFINDNPDVSINEVLKDLAKIEIQLMVEKKRHHDDQNSPGDADKETKKRKKKDSDASSSKKIKDKEELSKGTKSLFGPSLTQKVVDDDELIQDVVDDMPHDDDALTQDQFKQDVMVRPETPDPEWNKEETTLDAPDRPGSLRCSSKMGYDLNACLGIHHWGPKCQQFYKARHAVTSSHQVYSRMKILSIIRLSVDKQFGYGYLKEIVTYDGEINLGVEENMISNKYAVKLCLEHEVKRGNKVVKKELIVALRGEIYFVKFIINPKEDDVEPEVIFKRSFLRMTKAVTNFGSRIVTIYPDIDPFLEETKGEEKSNDDWDHLLDFNIDDVPLLGEE
uniref:Retrovirus-related Pol polyprotein from transposon TNT 1-94 n=1 Tax=Tanacetum cinerariifolium TaxID=118510 RepID=A0A6L2KAR1_TANCI|nr:hypothetical protein [Tanacetum cinerariifolium]